MNEPLHKFDQAHIDEDCSAITGFRENQLFFNCVFDDLRGLTLKDCDLNRSVFKTDSVEKALGFTLTLNCNSFRNVECSETLFDLLLALLVTTRGNEAKRKKLIEVIGVERASALLRLLKRVE